MSNTLSIFDFPASVEISVERHNIDRSIPGDPCRCMVADAINEALELTTAEVDFEIATVYSRDGVQIDYYLPPCVQDKIEDFDAGQHVESFKFTMTKMEAEQ
jgi:hypothetical protein